MSDPLIIQTLRQKRAEISGVIAAYQAKITQARHDLAHIDAVMRLVEGGEQERAQYIVNHGLFKKGEIADICLRHLKADGELDTRQLAERVMCECKLEVSDTPLRPSPRPATATTPSSGTREQSIQEQVSPRCRMRIGITASIEAGYL